MLDLIFLLARHGLTVLGGYLAAHGVTDITSTQGLVFGIVITLLVAAWSWIAKMLKFDAAFGLSPSTSDALRTALGVLISQGITFASAYFACNANDPSALLGAVVNVLASRYGVHQQLAHRTPLDVATAIQVLVACVGVLGLSSCATTTAILGSPFGRAVFATADQLAKAVITTTEQFGLEQIIVRATGKVAALNAEGVNSDLVKETLRLSEIAGLKAVILAAEEKYQALTGHAFTLPKNPVKVTVAAASRVRQNRLKPVLQYAEADRLKPGLQNAPVRLLEPYDEKVDGPGCMQLAERIPLYGERVAFMLSTGAVKD